MWKAQAGVKVANPQTQDADDDWETDADFVNDVSEEQQRWGAKTVEGSGHQASLSMKQLREDVEKDYKDKKQKELESGPKASYGYGGKFGVQQDRMDQSAVGADYHADLSKHASQTDAAKGFGGKYGVQSDRKISQLLDLNMRARQTNMHHKKIIPVVLGVNMGYRRTE